MNKEQALIHIISHTDYSSKIDATSIPRGEINNAKKLYKLLKNQEYPIAEIQDLNELFGIKDFQDTNAKILNDLTKLNVELATNEDEWIEGGNYPPIQTFLKKMNQRLSKNGENILLLLTWHIKTLSILSTGIQRSHPTIGKCYCCFSGEFSFSNFPHYACLKNLDLILCESLLAPIEGCKIGIPPWKFFYLPHIAPQESEDILSQNEEEKKSYRLKYLQNLAKKNQKELAIDEETVVIAYPTRFTRRKNVEILIEIIYELRQTHPNILLILKGNYDREGDFSIQYSDKLSLHLKGALKENWFLWDDEATPYPEILRIFSSFDICAYISGAESGNNTIVEMASLGIPCVVLNATTNPYMYKDMASFIEAGEKILGVWVFQQPLINDLKNCLGDLIRSKEKRKSLGERFRNVCKKRYGSRNILERIPLLLEAAKSIRLQDKNAEEYKKKLLDRLKQDMQEYSLEKEMEYIKWSL